MADICDQEGRPIQLTDELGRPVQLTDEFGRPIHLTGVATTEDSGPHAGSTGIGSEPKTHHGTHYSPTLPEAVGGAGVDKTMPGSAGVEPAVTGGAYGESQVLGRSGNSGYTAAEEEEKKGLMQKIKDKLPGYKSKEEKVPEKVFTATTKVTVTTPAGPPDEPKQEFVRVEHHEEEHEKKGLMDKIKDKLPGHHH